MTGILRSVKRNKLATACMILILAIAVVILLPIFLLLQPDIRSESYTFKTAYGDVFTIKRVGPLWLAQEIDFSLYAGRFSIFRKPIMSKTFINGYDPGKPKLVPLFNTAKYNCYCFSGEDNTADDFIIKDKIRTTYSSYSSAYFELMGLPLNDPSWEYAARTLCASGNWKCFYVFAEPLLKRKDADAIAQIRRYAAGRFTQREVDENGRLLIPPEEMQQFAKGLKKKYRL